MTAFKRSALATLALLAMAGSAQANKVWNWSFASEAGQFITADLPVASGYQVLDFTVTASAAGATLGSWLGGQYTTGAFSTSPPYYLAWDGSQVTDWVHFGVNSYHWLLFSDVASGNLKKYVFGWNTPNDNQINSAGLLNGSNPNPLAVGPLAVRPVPEPESYALLLAGLLAMAALKQRQRGA